MKFKEEKGDLFSLHERYTLVHCISQDCKMGAGIAIEFEARFRMREYLLNVIKQEYKSYPCSILCNNTRQSVINMITKDKCWNKPTYKTFEKALDDVVSICKENNIKYLAMPKIGCGLDKLQWSKVKQLIKDKFNNMDIEIIVRYL